MRLFRGLSVLAMFALVGGCDGPVGPPGPPGPPGPGFDGSVGGAIAITPATASVAVGETVTLAASGATTETYTWMSHDTRTATVDAAGVVTGVAVGEAFISATGADTGLVAFALVTVTAATGPVSFANDVLPLFTRGSVWFEGAAACNATGCHTGVGGAHDLDMGTHAGVLLGADAGGEPIVVAGDTEASSLGGRLRNNRMPWGISPLVPRDGPSVMSVRDRLGWTDASSATDTNGLVRLVEAWIDGNAPNGAFDYVDSASATVQKTFATDILPLFTTSELWAPGTEACNAAGCHSGVGGAHDLDMGTYAGIIAGADGGGEPILVPGDAEASELRDRLRNNRMPWGIPTWVPRNGPNGEVATVLRWIAEGAMDN